MRLGSAVNLGGPWANTQTSSLSDAVVFCLTADGYHLAHVIRCAASSGHKIASFGELCGVAGNRVRGGTPTCLTPEPRWRFLGRSPLRNSEAFLIYLNLSLTRLRGEKIEAEGFF